MCVCVDCPLTYQVVGGSIRTYQSFNSLATSMAISESNSLLSVETAPVGNDDKASKMAARLRAANNDDSMADGDVEVEEEEEAEEDDDDRQSVRSVEMTRLWTPVEPLNQFATPNWTGNLTCNYIDNTK